MADPLEVATAAGLRPGSEAWQREVRRLTRQRTQEEQWERAAVRFRAIWEHADPATVEHGYLKRQGVTDATGLRQIGHRLLIPMKSVEPGARIMNLQSIWPDGHRRFGKGGPAYHVRTTIGAEAYKPGGTLFIVEGWCTGWAVHQSTSAAVVVAFSAGNLGHVAVAMRAKYPDARIILASDNDMWTGGNPGLTNAQEAAARAGAELAVPDFLELATHPTDYLDLLRLEGEAAVRRWLDPKMAAHARTIAEHARTNGTAPPPGAPLPMGGPELEPTPADLCQQGEPPTLTDTGNAARLVTLHGAQLHHIAPWRKYLVFESEADGGRWTVDYGDVRVRELAKDVGRKLKEEALKELDEDLAKKKFSFAFKSLNAPGISGMVDLARGLPGIIVDHEALDRDGWLLGVQNGVIDLRSGAVRPARPTDLMTMQAPVKWDADAQAPRWERAHEEWFPDPDVRAYVKRVAGSALVGVQRDHILVILYGGGRNGKGTFVRALQRVLGPYALVIHLSLLVQQKYAQHDTVKADLFRARLAVASETQRRVKLDEASVKNLTGGDRITARRMREDPWEFDPSHSLWLQTNYLPEITGRDQGIWSRIRVVKWEACFSGREDKHLDDSLAAEAPGILRWLVEGCLEWQEHGLAEPEAVIRETLAYRRAEDTFSRFAAEVGLVFRRGLEIQAQELQELLEKWADEEGVNAPHQEVGEWLRENGVAKRQHRVTGPDGKERRPKFWVGVGLEDGKHETEQTDAIE